MIHLRPKVVIWIFLSTLFLFVHVIQAQDISNSRTIALKNVTVIDGTGTPPQPGQVIIIRDGIIKSISPVEAWESSDEEKVVDLTGQYIMPGLINGHVHLTAHRGNIKDHLRSMLEKGTTAVRDLGGDARTLSVLARDAQMGRIDAPNIYYSAIFFGPEFTKDPRVRFSSIGYEAGRAPWAQEITEETDLSLAVAKARGTGASGLKLYASLDASMISRITSEAHRQGLQVWAHATVFPTPPEKVLAAGVDGIEHLGLLRAANQNTVLPETWSEGFNEWLPDRATSNRGFNPDAFKDLYKKMASQDVNIGTTLHVAHRLSKEKNLEPGWSPEIGSKHKKWVCEATSATHNAGVALVAGTDLDGTVPIQEEMELLVECGLSPIEAIRSATMEAAKAIGIDDTRGSIKKGKVADIVVLDSDPTKNIQYTNNVVRVMKSGIWHDPREKNKN